MATGADESDRARAIRSGAVLRYALTHADATGDPPATDPPPSAAGLVDLTDRAEYHRVTPLVHAVADRIPDLEPSVAAGIAASYHFAVRTHLFVLDDLAWVATVLDDLAPDVLVIKGPVLAATVYPRPDLRSYSDLDVVVPHARFARAVQLLLDAGASFRETDWGSVVDRRLGEIALTLPSGTALDLHWHLIALGALRDRFSVPMDSLFERSRVVDLDGGRYRTLGTEDTLVHLALHAVLCGGDRLGWAKDLELAVRRSATTGPIDWDAMIATARRWGAGPALLAQLDRAHRLFGTAVPGAADLVPPTARGWATATALADRIRPPERSTGSPSLALALAYSTAPTTARSVRELARMGARQVRRRGPRTRGHDRDGAPAPVAPSAAQWRTYLDSLPA